MAITTTDEWMKKIEDSINFLVKKVTGETEEEKETPYNPYSEEILDVTEKTYFLLAKVHETTELLKTVQSRQEDTIEPITESDVAYNKRRDWSLLGANSILIVLALITLYKAPQIFPVVYGLLLGFVSIGAGIWVDDICLQGYTFKKVAKNAIASAILIGAFIWIIGTGIGYGTRIVSDTVSNDASQTTGLVRETIVAPVVPEVKDTIQTDTTVHSEN